MGDMQRDLTRTVLAVLFIGGLLALSLWILRPFLAGAIWAVMIVVATWPLMLAAQKAFWGRRWLAVVVMTVALLVVLIVPFSAAVATLAGNADVITGWIKGLSAYQLPAPPAWLAGVPVIGLHAAQVWRGLADGGADAVLSQLSPYAGELTKWFVAQAGTLGVLFLELLLTVAFAVIFYLNGEKAGEWVLRFAQRLAGKNGDAAVTLSVHAIRAVALGVVVTAFVQALLGGIGLAIVGVPFVAILTALMFMLSVAQIGALPVLVPAVIWLFWRDQVLLGSVLLAISVIVSLLDNILRPFLITKGANLPLLLVFLGVVGGLIAFGLIGIFVGPMVLAIGYTLLGAWLNEER